VQYQYVAKMDVHNRLICLVSCLFGRLMETRRNVPGKQLSLVNAAGADTSRIAELAQFTGLAHYRRQAQISPLKNATLHWCPWQRRRCTPTRLPAMAFATIVADQKRNGGEFPLRHLIRLLPNEA